VEHGDYGGERDIDTIAILVCSQTDGGGLRREEGGSEGEEGTAIVVL